MRLLDAANLVLPMMFLSRSSGLDDISLPIQSLSLAPFVVSGTQSGFFHGLQVHSSLPPITQVVDTFIPAVRRWLYLSTAEVVQVSNSPKLKFPIQPQCTRLDSPVFANSSKVISDSPTVLDFASYSPPATVHAEIVFSPVEWKVVLAWIAVSLLTVGFIFLEEHASAILSDVSYDRITALNVPACSRVILGVVSCGLLANYRLSEDANPHGALAGVGMIMYMLGEVRSLEALCRIGHVIVSPAVPPIATTMPIPTATDASLEYTDVKCENATAVGVETDMNCAVLVIDDGLQAIAPLRLTATVHLVHPRIQTEVVEQATAMSETSTQCDLDTIDTAIHLTSSPTSAVVVVDGETQTDILMESTTVCASPPTQPQTCIPPENFTPTAISVSQVVHPVGKADSVTEVQTPELVNLEVLQDGPCALGTPDILIGRSADKIDCIPEFLDSLGSSSALATEASHEYSDVRCQDAMTVSVQAVMARPPVFVNAGMQTIVPPRHPVHLVDVGTQTEVVEQATAIDTPTVIPSLSTLIISHSKVTIDTDLSKPSPTAPVVVVVDGETQTDTLPESSAPPPALPQAYVLPENSTPAATFVSQVLHSARKTDGRAEENKTPETVSPETLQDGPCALGTPNIIAGRTLLEWSADQIDRVAEFLDSLGSGSASDSMHASKGPAAHQSSCVPVSISTSLQVVPPRTLSNFETAKHGSRVALPRSGTSHQYPRPQAAYSIPSLATFPVPANPPPTLPLKDVITVDPFVLPRPVPVASGGSPGALVRSTLAYGKPGLSESIHASKPALPRFRLASACISPMSICQWDPSKVNAAVALVLPAKRRGHRPLRPHAMSENDDVIDWARA